MKTPLDSGFRKCFDWVNEDWKPLESLISETYTSHVKAAFFPKAWLYFKGTTWCRQIGATALVRTRENCETMFHKPMSSDVTRFPKLCDWQSQVTCYRPHPKDGGRYCFQLVCQSTHRWGVPKPGLDGGGGYPDQVWMVGGVPWPGLDGGGGYPSQVWMVWGYPSQVWMVGGTPPWPGLDGGGVPEGTPTSQVWMGYPTP